MELRNNDLTYTVALKFIELREKLGKDLIKVAYDKNKNKIVAFVRKKPEFRLDDVELKSLVEELQEKLVSIRGVERIEIDNNSSEIRIFVNRIYPELFEDVSVIVYEIGKEFEENIEWKIIEVT
ncbi:hypothetical protein [Stygiolobus caldivivus]|uniref:Uncharacterized protein n=1 Tax=Stygiolobus caldivivus TaxID=2824673 RepID=A0A8D5ZJC7_9CREN|nr:hypothetical protein [Stygiolobus caldivivus]BCU71444.1 hypothetical protein KN1_27410 [Stygiolobus caldivivus]